jgi:hypothetical protein
MLVFLVLVGQCFRSIYSALFGEMSQLLLHVSPRQASEVALLAGHEDQPFVDIFAQ